ncbi:MAG: hypothetical protein U0361_02095 [Nitrospiraceae bacterium]
MTNLVSVPPGFTISTEACVEYYNRGKAYPPAMMDQFPGLKRIERSMNAGFGDPEESPARLRAIPAPAPPCPA